MGNEYLTSFAGYQMSSQAVGINRKGIGFKLNPSVNLGAKMGCPSCAPTFDAPATAGGSNITWTAANKVRTYGTYNGDGTWDVSWDRDDGTDTYTWATMPGASIGGIVPSVDVSSPPTTWWIMKRGLWEVDGAVTFGARYVVSSGPDYQYRPAARAATEPWLTRNPIGVTYSDYFGAQTLLSAYSADNRAAQSFTATGRLARTCYWFSWWLVGNVDPVWTVGTIYDQLLVAFDVTATRLNSP